MGQLKKPPTFHQWELHVCLRLPRKKAGEKGRHWKMGRSPFAPEKEGLSS